MNALETNTFQLDQLGLVAVGQDELAHTDGGLAPLVVYGIYALCVAGGIATGYVMNH